MPVGVPIYCTEGDLPLASRVTDTRVGELRAFARFAVVGIASNATLFVIYLILTGLGTDPLVAATLMWILGVTMSFALNRSWTFRHTGSVAPALARYGLLYGTAYVLNLALLVLGHPGRLSPRLGAGHADRPVRDRSSPCNACGSSGRHRMTDPHIPFNRPYMTGAEVTIHCRGARNAATSPATASSRGCEAWLESARARVERC